jgi:HAD superfamily hydrolase (TIGR01509 family)
MKTIFVDAVNTFVIRAGETFEIFKEMQVVLDNLPNRKIILTNADDAQLKKFGLDKMPYEIFTLKHNPEKTDPRYFEIMLRHFGLDKSDAVYFEHNLEAIKSARSVGISTHRYDPDKKDLSALKAFLEESLRGFAK